MTFIMQVIPTCHVLHSCGDHGDTDRQAEDQQQPEEMTVTTMSVKTVESTLPANGFGIPDIYVDQGQKEEETDRLFVDSDGDYGEETCED